MNINQLKNEADNLMRKIVARYNGFYTSNNAIPRIELDLMLSDLSKLYDTFKTLSFTDEENLPNISEPLMNQKEEMNPKEEHVPVHEKFSEQEKVEETPESEPEEVSVSSLAEEMTDEPEFREQPAHVEPQAANTNAAGHTIPGNKEPEIIQPARDQHSTIADQFKNPVKTIGESSKEFSNPVEQRLGAQVSDLKSAIGLYEKFNFINDLFAGDSLAYERTIVQLNGMINFREADNYLNGVRAHYKWDGKSESVIRFMEILKRKFS